ncbi:MULTISPECIES: RHS repeat-associated core domain-containing protein [Pseudomonas]|uniref:RHS repeat-associated core domain-containing protein n=1 Tax=Pseudomonas TaxID=286 RepID=UPI001BEA03DA|nr:MULTISPECIES: RHS repeat-associated core domain-containing protein [Pseudomonas]MBT2340993.1 RHS repeat-associated core domain-containing protein [Pseudomonas fluorescens]MCD4532467.1 RHS repeat-associated core domain-containing protein [Pseudomonas sp. C3-2018]
MSLERENLSSRYGYDPLDRLVDYIPSTQASSRRFYLKERLSTEIQALVEHSIFQQGDQLLAQQLHQNDAVKTTLFTTDQQRSVVHALSTQLHTLIYMPYGHRASANGLLTLLGFHGERPDTLTGHYLLGNGYRAYNPVLMRFNSPDSLSPFGKGGLNTYVYCTGDPVNRTDPTGHTWRWVKFFLRNAGIMRRSAPAQFTPPSERRAIPRSFTTQPSEGVSMGNTIESPSLNEWSLETITAAYQARDRLRAENPPRNSISSMGLGSDIDFQLPTFHRPNNAAPDYFPPSYRTPNISSENLANVPLPSYIPPMKGRRWSSTSAPLRQIEIRRTSI